MSDDLTTNVCSTPPKFSPWASRYNREKEFGDQEIAISLDLTGIWWGAVSIPDPPCGIGHNHALCEDRVLTYANVKGIRSIRSIYSGHELQFDDNGNGSYDYGSVLNLRARPPHENGNLLEIAFTLKSWADRKRVIEFYITYIPT